MSQKVVDEIIVFTKRNIDIIKHPKITDAELRRHYGLDSSSLKKLEIFEFNNQLNLASSININVLTEEGTPKSIFLLINRLSDFQFLVPPVEFDLLSPINLELMFQYERIFKKLIAPIFLVGDQLPSSDFDVSSDSIESTNFHFVLHYKSGENIRFKKYTRFTIAQTREAVLAQILSKNGLFPKFYAVLEMRWEKIVKEFNQPYDFTPLGIFIENIPNSKNIEGIFASFYLTALRYPNRRSIGTITTFQKELLIVMNYLEKFEKFLNSISKEKKLITILGDADQGYKVWKKEFEEKLNRIRINIDLPDININDLTNDFQIIHGDCWLRQFVKSDEKIILLDLEDICYGHILYDLASLVNSLEQQNDYFKIIIAKETDEVNWIVDLKFSFMNFILEKIPSHLLKNFVLLRIMRMIHELDYILQYQPNLTWLIDVLTKRITTLTIKLHGKDLEYLELLRLE
ncbi:MAG: hypothetical protein HeimC3_54210 [Candidatus Heimdallarchaeota archaeon LC_3]|nr:MAG: hypothetical protein HeimC3_54210 [Candidatus Heimdallarchaeota archaeon LC_3]